jgi:hypothetical protein
MEDFGSAGNADLQAEKCQLFQDTLGVIRH